MVDIEKVSDLIFAVSAEKIMPRFQALTEKDKWYKGIGGIVTIVDIESEKFLAESLSQLLPGSFVLGEESASDEDQPYSCLEQEAPVWIIDPLDGTNNFAKGGEDFVVIIALSIEKRIRAGWIYAPFHQILLTAEEGGGAWLGEQRLQLSNGPSAAQMRGALGRRFREYPGIQECFATLTNASCCGMEYLDLARGKLDFAHFRRLKPWDHAAGELIVREAGGFAACLDGTLYQPGDTPTKGLLSARDKTSWKVIAEVIDPVFDTFKK